MAQDGVVNSWNEWDPLEEVIVGTAEGAVVPEWRIELEATMAGENREFFHTYGGKPFPEDLIAAAQRELDDFAATLQRLGVTVRRPEPINFLRSYGTPHWTSATGMYAAMPRDVALVMGDVLVEAPMAYRSRYYETDAYRHLFLEYFRRGARWLNPPRPLLTDDLYADSADLAQGEWLVTEAEPTFDAAEFIRFGRDVFTQRGHVTNEAGIEWMRRTFGIDVQFHLIDTLDPHAMHIDATLMPLCPGKALINRERLADVPDILADWDVRDVPPSTIPHSHPMWVASRWVNMNVLMLDEDHVIVERDEEPIIDLLRDWGFETIPCAFRHVNSIGGSFHCATLDVRRRGTLKTYR